MSAAPALALGVVLAGALWAVARQFDSERRVVAVGLAVAALVYVGFAVGGQAGLGWLAVEGIGLAVYGGLAWAGWRGSAHWLALGWALHSVWDGALYLMGAGGAFVPAGYAWLCLSFDLVMAVAAWRLEPMVGEPSDAYAM